MIPDNFLQMSSQSQMDWFCDACFWGNVDAVQQFLQTGLIDVNQLDSSRRTPPIHAATGKLAVMRLLIEHGAKLDVVDLGGETPLHKACRRGETDILRLLLNHGASVNYRALQTGCDDWFEFRCASGYTALHCAAALWSVEIVKILLDHGADVHCKDDVNRSPLFIACRRDHERDIIKLLLQHGADPNEKTDRGESSFYACIAGGSSEETAQLLLDHGAVVNTKDLDLAVRRGELANLCMDHGAYLPSADVQHGDYFASKLALSWYSHYAPIDMGHHVYQISWLVATLTTQLNQRFITHLKNSHSFRVNKLEEITIPASVLFDVIQGNIAAFLSCSMIEQ
jgi:ankyrin repeat protein